LTAEQKEILQRMQSSTQRLARMANAMFQLSVTGRVEQQPKLQEGDLRECVAQALHEAALLAGQKRVSIAVDLAPQPQGLLFEKAQIEEVLLNLLDNACKFTPRGGAIDVRGYPFFWDRRRGQSPRLDPLSERRTSQSMAENSYRADIRDSGPGISNGQLVAIFEEYTSYAGGQDRSGGGLGLAICRMLVRRHYGDIWAARSLPGAMFSFVLPIHPAPVVKPRPSTD
jgi:two-component system clock-associated histidine kinase SasA